MVMSVSATMLNICPRCPLFENIVSDTLCVAAVHCADNDKEIKQNDKINNNFFIKNNI